MARKATDERGTLYAGLLAGIRKVWASRDTILIGGVAWKPQDLVAVLQSLLDAIEATRVAYAGYRSKVATQRQLEKRYQRLVADVVALVRAQHGSDARMMQTFDLPRPKKTGPKTVAAKAAMVEKAKATRATRPSRGKKRRRA